MYKQIELTELYLVILAKNYNPSLLNPGFLRYSGIIPYDWQLAQAPVSSQQASQIVYSNGVNIIAQPNRLIFAENLAGILPKNLNSSQIADRYIETLSQLDYQEIGINFRSYVTLNHETDSEYLFKNDNQNNSTQQAVNSNVKPALNFTYNFSDNCLYLEILQRHLQRAESELVSALLFNGNFARKLGEEKASNKSKKLQQIIANWQEDLETYQNVVSQFIQETEERSTERISVLKEPVLVT